MKSRFLATLTEELREKIVEEIFYADDLGWYVCACDVSI